MRVRGALENTSLWTLCWGHLSILCAALPQQSCGGGVAIGFRVVQRRPSEFIHGIYVRIVIEQQLQNVDSTSFGSVVQWCLVTREDAIGFRAAFEQERHHWQFLSPDRAVQSCAAGTVHGVNIGAGRNKHLHRLEAAKISGNL